MNRDSSRPERPQLPPFTENGILLINKPSGWTSNDVVSFLRARFNVSKVGHCGTLDPAATGLLIVVFGAYTKFSIDFSGQDKAYEAKVLFGTETDTQDMDGKVIRTGDISGLTEEQVRETVMSFLGDSMQVPPMVSAIKLNGKKLCDLARKGKEVVREPRPITIHSIQIDKIELPYAEFTVSCSKGTYIRSLASDIGEKLGCGAVLCRLNRIASGSFHLNDAIPLDEVREWTQADLSRSLSYFQHHILCKTPGFIF